MQKVLRPRNYMYIGYLSRKGGRGPASTEDCIDKIQGFRKGPESGPESGPERPRKETWGTGGYRNKSHIQTTSMLKY